MSDEQPRAEWIFPEEKKSNKKRIWLIVVLSVVAIAIVAALLFMFLPRGDGAPGASPSPSSSASSTPSPSSPATDEPTPIPSPPPMPEPDLDTFAGQVQPRLDDAATGLGLVAGMSGPDAIQVIDSLQGDAGRLSEEVAPGSISSKWYAAVSEYASSLDALRSAIDGGGAAQSELDSATASLNNMRELVGL